MKLKTIVLTAVAVLLSTAANAQDPVKIGMITTMSGPAGYLGEDIRDGFTLAIEQEDGTLGGHTVDITVQDDALKPGNARQIADRMLSEGIEIFTGIVFANLAAAAVPDILNDDAIFIAPNTAAAEFAGASCHRNYFVSSWQDDSQGESAGALAESEGYETAFLVAPNYQAGRETMEAFKRYFTGEILGEVYTGLDQADFSTEMAKIRSAAPDVVYEFQPGGLGIAFLRQYQQAGLIDQIPLVVHPASLDQAILQAVGDAAKGVLVTSHWSEDFDNPVNQAFVSAWKAKYGDRPITYYAAQGYDAALMVGAGLEDLDGFSTEAFRENLLKADIPSVRGPFKFGPNQHPVQDWYALRGESDADGNLTLVTQGKVLSEHADIYASDCKL